MTSTSDVVVSTKTLDDLVTDAEHGYKVDPQKALGALIEAVTNLVAERRPTDILSVSLLVWIVIEKTRFMTLSEWKKTAKVLMFRFSKPVIEELEQTSQMAA